MNCNEFVIYDVKKNWRNIMNYYNTGNYDEKLTKLFLKKAQSGK